MGANSSPTTNKVESMTFGVRIGCHAFSRCCLKAVSEKWFVIIQLTEVMNILDGLFQLPLFLLFSELCSPSAESCVEPLRLRKGDMMERVILL